LFKILGYKALFSIPLFLKKFLNNLTRWGIEFLVINLPSLIYGSKKMNKSELHEESIFVFTHKTTEFLTSINGSTSWKIEPSRAKKCKYIVCIKNVNHDQVNINEYASHGEAFLIGRVSDVVPSSTNKIRGEDRYTVKFDQYAEINSRSKAWKKLCGGQRWPVKYLKTAELPEMFLNELAFNFNSLDFQDVQEENWEFANKYLEKENEILGFNIISKISHGGAVAEFIGGPETPDQALALIKNRRAYEMKDSDDLTIPKGISIKEAKTRLSFEYDIPEENIEIILKG
jgi:hypothetical protein